MQWSSSIKGFKAYLRLEKALSKNSIDAYLRDVTLLKEFIDPENSAITPIHLKTEHIRDFLKALNQNEINIRSQARILSGIRAFYKYLLIEELIADDPTELIDAPKISRKIPDFLSLEEVNAIIAEIDMSLPAGQRDRAIMELLYGGGLRVSEVCALKVSGLFFNDGIIKVFGKGSKERLIPINEEAIKHIELYRTEVRVHWKIKEEARDILFLNQRGSGLSRISIFNLVKKLTADAGIKKKVSPHTFRHSFATHLVENGADLRAVQEILGHESITTTEIYTHLDKRFIRKNILKYHPRNNR